MQLKALFLFQSSYHFDIPYAFFSQVSSLSPVNKIMVCCTSGGYSLIILRCHLAWLSCLLDYGLLKCSLRAFTDWKSFQTTFHVWSKRAFFEVHVDAIGATHDPSTDLKWKDRLYVLEPLPLTRRFIR